MELEDQDEIKEDLTEAHEKREDQEDAASQRNILETKDIKEAIFDQPFWIFAYCFNNWNSSDVLKIVNICYK